MADVIELSKEETAFFNSKGESDGPAPEKTPEPETPPEAKAEAAPETPAEAEPEETSGGDPRKALHEERERRRAIAKERDEAKLSFAKLQSRLDTLTEIAKTAANPQPQKPAEPEIPDINVDPVGHFRVKSAMLEKQVQDMAAWKTAQEQQFTQTNNVQRISQIAQVQEGEFKKITPDYDQASQHLINQRDAELVAYGITDPMERKNIIAQDAMTIAANALANGKNPAQVIYDMSKARGYSATPKPATASAAPAQTIPTETEEVRMAAAGQKAGASLGQLNGAASPPTTLEALAKMSEDEFAEATKGNNWRKLMGG